MFHYYIILLQLKQKNIAAPLSSSSFPTKLIFEEYLYLFALINQYQWVYNIFNETSNKFPVV